MPESSRNIENLCEEVAPPAGQTGFTKAPAPLQLLCEQTIDAEDYTDTNANCAQMDCTDASPHLNFKIKGGVEPYIVTIVGIGGENPPIAGSVSGGVFQITPPVNSGGTPGTLAFYIIARSQDPNDCSNVGTVCLGRTYDCNDDAIGGFGDTFGCDCNVSACPHSGSGGNNCANITAICQGTGMFDCGLPTCVPSTGDFGAMIDSLRVGDRKDCRTQTMIDNACAPCIPSVNGSIVTVTDARGTTVARTLLA